MLSLGQSQSYGAVRRVVNMTKVLLVESSKALPSGYPLKTCNKKVDKKSQNHPSKMKPRLGFEPRVHPDRQKAQATVERVEIRECRYSTIVLPGGTYAPRSPYENPNEGILNDAQRFSYY